MKAIKLPLFFLCVLFLNIPISSKAVVDITPEKKVQEEKPYSKKKIKTKKKKWFKSFFKNIFQKKIKKTQDSNQQTNLDQKSKTALLFGILALTGWAIGRFILYSFLSFSAAFGIGIILSIIGLFAGLITSSTVLKTIKSLSNNSDYKKEKNRAKWGLALSIITLVILGIFLIAVLSFSL